MKNVFKKVMAFMMATTLVAPLTSVFAISGNYYVYGVGDKVNFYINDEEKSLGDAGDQNVGRTTVILKDEGKDSQYVKALVTGFVSDGKTVTVSTPIDYSKTGFEYSERETTSPIMALISKLGENKFEAGEGKAVKDLESGVGLITLQELVDVFGAAKNADGTYSIDLNKKIGTYDVTVKEALAEAADAVAVNVAADQAINDPTATIVNGSGFYTSTLSEDETKVYVVKFEYDSEYNLTAAKVELEAIPETFGQGTQTVYSLIPTLYLDKTYDCHSHEEEKTYACYVCDNEYVWEETGKQADSCKVSEKITDKAKCVKPVETGISEYIAEFVGVASICAIALILVKRKDLFKSI